LANYQQVFICSFDPQPPSNNPKHSVNHSFIMKKYFLLCPLLFTTMLALSQGEIPVDFHTGQPIVQIPLWTIQDYDISTPVKLVYSTTGISAGQNGYDYGVGWNLQGGGSISRDVRGLPDDFTDGTRLGWLFGTCGSQTLSFGNSSDLSSNCPNTDEASDFNAIYNFNYLIDTEPDIFHYNVAGMSGDFVFDNSQNIRLMPLRDILITPQRNTNGLITGFTFLTDDGNTYTLAKEDTVWRAASTKLTSVEYLKRDYQFYKTPVRYDDQWGLTQITSPSGATTTFTYQWAGHPDIITPVHIAIRKTSLPINNTSSGTFDTLTAYTIKEASSGIRLAGIQASSGQSMTFFYKTLSSNPTYSISIWDSRRAANDQLVKSFTLSFVVFNYSNRKFLSSITEYSGCDQMPPYVFNYANLDLDDLNNDPLIYEANNIDFWGYYNGKSNTSLYPTLYVYPSLSGADRYRLFPIPNYNGTSFTLNGSDRTITPGLTAMGALTSINYPSGGQATLGYEAHDFYDATAGQNNSGGGIRIKSMTYFDGMNPSTLISKQFSYAETGTGHSSGRLISQPQFAIPTWQYINGSTTKLYGTYTGQDVWDYFTARTDQDISAQETSDGNAVIYGEVTVTRTGAGSANYKYSQPGYYGETTDGSWTATQDKFARPSDCPTMGVIDAGGAWRFPYAFNSNFDHERGLVSKETEYSSTGAMVRKTTTKYQYRFGSGTAPTQVWGLTYDKYANSTENIFLFGKYALLTDVDKVVQKEWVTTFDATDTTKSVTDTTQYFYASTYHKLLTSVRRTTSDGTVHTTQITYPLDFRGIPATNTDKALTMIADMQSSFMNGIPIEQVSKVTIPTKTEEVIGASLTKFNDFGLGKILSDSVFSLSLASGVTDFQPATMAVSAGTTWLKHDSRYELAGKFLTYDSYQRPVTQRGMNRVVNTTYWGYNKTLPVVQAQNASAGQFAFSDFETATGYEFQLVSGYTAYYGTGRTGVNALYPGAAITQTLNKANVSNYILSFWINSTAALGFTIVIKNASGTTIGTYTPTVPASGGTTFAYYSQKIPVTGVTTTTFSIQLQAPSLPANPSGGSSPTLMPVIDDLAFYPETAMLGSVTYAFPYGQASVTNAQHQTSTTVYDHLGRVHYVLDQDKNIVKRNTYTYSGLPAPPFTADFTFSALPAGSSSTFNAITSNCVSGVTYMWDFGEGAGLTAGTLTATHTYNNPGTYNVTLQVSAAGYNTSSQTYSLTIAPTPIYLTICGKGVAEYSTCTNGALLTYVCSSISGTPGSKQTIFGVESVTPSTEIVASYQWWQSTDPYGQYWTNVSQGSQYTGQLGTSNTPYFMKLVATMQSGKVATSNIMAVTVTSSCN
jgi:PKD domain